MRSALGFKVAAVAALSAIAVVGVVAFLSAGGSADPASFAVLGIICILALTVVVFAVIWNRRMARKTTGLNARSAAIFDIVREASLSSPLGRRERADLQEDVLDLLLTAQADGRTADDVTGNDPRAFVDGMLAAYGTGAPRRWLRLLDPVLYFLGYAAGLQALLALEEPSAGGFFAAAADHSILVFLAALSLVLPLVRSLVLRYAAKRRYGPMLLLPLLALPVGAALAFIALMHLLRTKPEAAPGLLAFMDGTTVVFDSPAALAVGALLFASVWALRRSLSRRRQV
jgi:hypothetical protein